MNEYKIVSKKLKALNEEYLSRGESITTANTIVNIVKNEYLPSTHRVHLYLWVLMFFITFIGTCLATFLEVQYLDTAHTNTILTVTWSLSGIIGISIGFISIKRERDLVAYKEIRSDYLQSI